MGLVVFWGSESSCFWFAFDLVSFVLTLADRFDFGDVLCFGFNLIVFWVLGFISGLGGV